MKKITSLILAVLMIFTLLAGCGEQAEEVSTKEETTEVTETAEAAEDTAEAEETEEALSEETLRVCIAEEPAQLMKCVAEIGSAALYISSTMVDSLLWYNTETGEIEPNLATAWEWIDDTHLQVTLRDDVVAPDGSNITANDLLYTIKIATESGTTDNNMLSYEESSVVDDYTAIIGLIDPYATLVDKLCNDGFLTVVSESSVEAVGGLEAATRCPQVFTGPYIFDEWVEGQYIRVVRNDNYWNTERCGYYKYIEFSFVPDAATRAMALQSGDVDVAVALSSAQDAVIESSPDLSDANGYALANNLIYFNCSTAPFDDINVRHAVWDLVDVEGLNIAIENGKSVPVEANLSTGSTMYKARPEGWTREVNVDEAKELLAEAGYADGLTVDCYCEAVDSTLAEMLASQLAEGGITMNINVVESTTIQTQVTNGDYTMALTASYHSDPARILNRLDSTLFGTSAGGGGFFYASDDLNALVAEAKSTFDDEARKEVYGEIQDFIIDNYLCVGLYGKVNRHATTADIGNYIYNLPGNLLVAYLRPVD